MPTETKAREAWLTVKMMTIILFAGGVAGCAGTATQPVEPPTPTSPPILSPTAQVQATQPSGWETFTNQQGCRYDISYPADMEGSNQGTYSWTFSLSVTEPVGIVTNFIYISVIPDDFQAGGDEIIYNYDPAEAQSLLDMQVGESKPLREDPETAQWFTYTRLPDTVLTDGPAQTYENTQPWEFPERTKEIRHYLQANGCTYLIGGYLDAAGSQGPGAIPEELFDEIVATFGIQ
jgi:hypothetical protein